MINFDPSTAFKITGLVYLLMPLIVWVTLSREHSHKVALWCGGGFLFGIGVILIGFRGSIPSWVSITISNLLIFTACMVRIQSLRIDLAVPWRNTLIVVAVVAFAGAFELIQDGFNNEPLRVQFALLVDGSLLIYQSSLARRIAQAKDSRNANWIAGVYLLLGSVLILRFVEMTAGGPVSTVLISNVTTGLMVVLGLLSAVVGNVAYIGIFLERAYGRENKSLETQRNLSIALEQISAAVAITDARVCIEYVNAAFTKVTGYSFAEVVGKNPRILQSGQTPLKTYREMWDNLGKGLAWEGELLNRRKNGEFYWEEVHIAAVKNLEGVVTHYFAVKTDINSRRQAAEALRINEHRLRLLADSARDVIWDRSPDGTVTYISPSVEAVRGYTPAEAMQQTIAETLTPDSLAIAMNFFMQVVTDVKSGRVPKSFREELQFRCKDGSTFWGDVMAHPIVDAEGGVRIIGVTRDIVESKRHKMELENEARRLTSQIAQMDRQRSLGEMSASLSHELNQPLTAILTNAQVGQRGLKAGRFEAQRIEEFFEKIIVNTRRAGEIIDKIRGFIRPAEVTQVPVDLQRLASDILDLVGPEAAEYNVAVIFSPYASSMWVNGDATQLSQVLMNIYRNAIEALRASELREIHVQLMRFGDRLSLSVCDTGPGLAPEMLQKAGTPFLTTKAGGLGLGLSIARSIIAQHQGTLSVGIAGGGGACVDIDLPLLPASTEVRS